MGDVFDADIPGDKWAGTEPPQQKRRRRASPAEITALAEKLVHVAEAPSLVAVFERLARDQSVDVAKLRELIDLHRTVLEREAKAAFWTAFVPMQAELPSISRDGAILDKSDQVRNKYATNHNIQVAIRPILMRYGFGLSFRNAEARQGFTTVTGMLAHTSGHVETDTFTGPTDNTGGKNDTQALGSTRSYGARYTTISLLNIIAEDEDDDGKTAGRKQVQAPLKFNEWWNDMTATADNGLAALNSAWADSPGDLKNHVHLHYRSEWNALKAKAAKVKA